MSFAESEAEQRYSNDFLKQSIVPERILTALQLLINTCFLPQLLHFWH